MAKQMVGPLERHFEKALLGVTGLLLVGAAAMYLVTSPNQVELGGESVTPGTIDGKLAKRASIVRDDIRRAPSEAPDALAALAPSFESKLDPFGKEKISRTLPSTATIGPDIPVADESGAAPGERSLVAVAPLGEPGWTAGRSTFTFYDKNGEQAFSVANWVTLSAVFDVKEQSALQRAEYGGSRKEVHFGRAQLQRREQGSDGNWSDDDWQDVIPWPKPKLGPPPFIQLVEAGGVVSLSDRSLRDLGDYIEGFMDPRAQLDALRPLLPEILNGDGWSFPVLTTFRDVVDQDQEFLFPEDPDADTWNRYVVEERARPAASDSGTLTYSERKKQRTEEFAKLMASAQKNQDPEDARRAYNEAADIKIDPEAPSTDAAKALKMMAEAEQLEFDIARRKKKNLGRPQRQQPQPGGNAPVRVAHLTQQMWVHDVGPGSVVSGKTYQYRMRPVVYNRLVGEPDKFRDKQNAGLVLIPGPWTEPVEIAIPRDTVFFLTGKDQRKGKAKFQFYKWEEGVWTQSRRFAFSVGDRLAGESRCKLPSPDDSGASYNALVDFDVDATIVDIDFERTYRERKRVSSSRTGVKFATPSKACSVVFVDGSGRLHERFVPTEKANPERKDAAGMVYTGKP